MNTLSRLGAGAILLAIFSMTAGCQNKSATPEQQCSAQETYDALTGLMASAIASASVNGMTPEITSAASSRKALKNVVSFHIPTLADVNPTTHKVSCNAMMRLTVDSPGQQMIDRSGLEVNEVAGDHLEFAIHYSVQPAADASDKVIELDQAGALGAAALQASIVAIQKLRGAGGTAAPSDMSVQISNSTDIANAQDSEGEDNDTASSAPESSQQPEDQAPQPSASESNNAAADDARRFATDYFTESSAGPDEALDFISTHLADRVRFFGKDTPRDLVLKQKADYLKRWPSRNYAIEPGSVRIECKPGQPLCHVAGIVSWSAQSLERGASASGKSSFDLVTLNRGGSQLIVAEDSRVLSRDAQ